MKKILFVLILMCALITTAYGYSQNIMNELDNKIVRLHILAHSNDEYDQAVKLWVRNEILNAVNDTDIKDTDKFLKCAEERANKYLTENNIPYRAHAEYGMFYFPRKTYGSISLPAGKYYGVRVLLGSGEGENWWCIMYPPLCVTDDGNVNAGEKTDMELNRMLNSEAYDLISGSSKDVQIKFRTVEIINKLKSHFGLFP